MNSQKGFIAPLLLVLIAFLLLGGGAYVYVQQKQANQAAVASPIVEATSTAQMQTSRSIKDVHKGDTFGDLTIKDVGYATSSYNGKEYISSAWALYSGSIILSGKVFRINIDTPNPICITIDEKDLYKIPLFKEGNRLTQFCLDNPESSLPTTFRNLRETLLNDEGIPVTIEVNNYQQTVTSESDPSDTASFVRIVQ